MVEGLLDLNFEGYVGILQAKKWGGKAALAEWIVYAKTQRSRNAKVCLRSKGGLV